MVILIRHVEEKDIAEVKAIYDQPGCYSGTLQIPFPSEAFWRERITNIPGNLHNLVAEVDGKVKGQMTLEVLTSPRRKHAARIGMAVSQEYQNKGIGYKLIEAAIDLSDNWLGITRIELGVFTDNKTAIKLYEKFGFEIEGCAKSYALRNGEYVDTYYMARIKKK